MIQQENIHMEQLLGDNPLLSFLSCSYLLPIKIGLGRCETIANLYLCIWPWCSHPYWCHEEGIPRWVIIPTSHLPHGLKVRGRTVSLVLLFLHNFSSVSVKRYAETLKLVSIMKQPIINRWLSRLLLPNVYFIGHLFRCALVGLYPTMRSI